MLEKEQTKEMEKLENISKWNVGTECETAKVHLFLNMAAHFKHIWSSGD